MTRAPAVSLRPFTPEDTQLLWTWAKDFEVARWMGEGFTSPGETRQWFLSLKRDGKAYAIEAAGHNCGTPIGYLVLEHLNYKTGSVEMRICIGESDYRNRGYGRQAILMLLDMLRMKPALKEVYLRVDPDNTRAVRCYKRCGFQKEGLLRKSASVPRELLLMTFRFP